jgi:hypothetical protein
MMWPTHLPIEQLAYVANIGLARARRWARVGAIKPVARDGKRFVYARDETVLATVLRRLQEFLGPKSGTPLSAAAALRPIITGWLRPDEPHFVEPLVVTLPAHCVALELKQEDVAALIERLDALTTSTTRG